MENTEMVEKALPISGFRFSTGHTTLLAELSSEYTLVTIAIDNSGSVHGFQDEIINCLKEVITSCKSSRTSDTLLVRVIIFASQVKEFHGFTLVENINLNDYTFPNASGNTALFDAIANSVEACILEGQDLVKNDVSVNGINVIITDGMDNNSSNTALTCKSIFDKVNIAENLESMTSILIGININDMHVKQSLSQVQNEVGIDQLIITARDFGKVAGFISSSISSTSAALKSGAKSVLLNFN